MKPQTRKPVNAETLLDNYTNPKHPDYDAEFDAKIRSLAPQWFEDEPKVKGIKVGDGGTFYDYGGTCPAAVIEVRHSRKLVILVDDAHKQTYKTVTLRSDGRWRSKEARIGGGVFFKVNKA